MDLQVATQGECVPAECLRRNVIMCHTCDSSTPHIHIGPDAGLTTSYGYIWADRPWQTEIRNGLPTGWNGSLHRCLI